jgi:hypothetical protein
MIYPPSILDSDAFRAARSAAVAELLGRRNAAGHWIGRLSSSALSTAPAVNARRLAQPIRTLENQIRRQPHDRIGGVLQE